MFLWLYSTPTPKNFLQKSPPHPQQIYPDDAFIRTLYPRIPKLSPHQHWNHLPPESDSSKSDSNMFSMLLPAEHVPRLLGRLLRRGTNVDPLAGRFASVSYRDDRRCTLAASTASSGSYCAPPVSAERAPSSITKRSQGWR